MTISLTGKIERQGFGTGIWALVTETGKTYELKDAPPELCQVVDQVQVEGQIRDDIMTFAMIGPVFEVKSFTVISA
jgi:hypothetical protein